MSDKRQALKVEVPGQRADHVPFARVGLIALVGFAIGIAWPRLAGVKLVPSVPVPAAIEASARELTGAPPEQKAAEEARPLAPTVAPEKPPAERVLVSEAQVVSCRNKHGKRVQACDKIAFDGAATQQLRGLASCGGTDGAVGILSLGFELDFASGTIKSIQSGRSTSLPAEQTERFLGCVRKSFGGVSLAGIAHEQESYSVFYRLELLERADNAPPAEGLAPGQPPVIGSTPASGTATVSWDVALVRAEAKRDAEVKARVLAGTRVVVTAKRGDWFRVKYDAKGNQGWIFRTAIGM